jgi:hypothetical protein
MTRPYRNVMPPTKEEQLLALKRGVPEGDWEKIAKLATSLPNADALATTRELVLCRRLLLLPPLPRKPDEHGLAEKKRANRIAKASEALLKDVNQASGLASVFEAPESVRGRRLSDARGNADEWMFFLYYLEKLHDRATLIGAPIRPPPHNVDGRRDLVLIRLLVLYERATNGKARVSKNAIDGHAFGKIVDFVQTFFRTVPGWKIAPPTGDQIRGVERNSRDERHLPFKHKLRGKVFAKFADTTSAEGVLKAKAEDYRSAQTKLGKRCSEQQAFTVVYTDPANADLKKRYDAEVVAKRPKRSSPKKNMASKN